jgi:osmotically inducible protein OsmC
LQGSTLIVGAPGAQSNFSVYPGIDKTFTADEQSLPRRRNGAPADSFTGPEEHSMATRKAEAVWQGNLKEGQGNVKLGSGAFQGRYSFSSRFEEGTGTNPEELIAAAHAGCFSMALSAGLGKSGFNPKSVQTNASVQLEKVGEGFKITKISLQTRAQVPGIDEKTFQEHAQKAKTGCPVSQALAATPIELDAKLVSG